LFISTYISTAGKQSLSKEDAKTRKKERDARNKLEKENPGEPYREFLVESYLTAYKKGNEDDMKLFSTTFSKKWRRSIEKEPEVVEVMAKATKTKRKPAKTAKRKATTSRRRSTKPVAAAAKKK